MADSITIYHLEGGKLVEGSPPKKMKVSYRGRRLKGKSFEREVVALFQAAGIGADRIPLSGAAGGRFDHDVNCPVRGVDRKVECKKKARAWKNLYDWLYEGNYALAISRDRAEPLIVLRLKDFAELAK